MKLVESVMAPPRKPVPVHQLQPRGEKTKATQPRDPESGDKRSESPPEPQGKAEQHAEQKAKLLGVATRERQCRLGRCARVGGDGSFRARGGYQAAQATAIDVSCIKAQ